MTSTTNRARCLCGSHSSIEGGSRKLVMRSVGRKLARRKCPEEDANRRYDSNTAPIRPPERKSDRWGGRPPAASMCHGTGRENLYKGTARDEHYHDWPGYRQVCLPDPRCGRNRKNRDQTQTFKE